MLRLIAFVLFLSCSSSSIFAQNTPFEINLLDFNNTPVVSKRLQEKVCIDNTAYFRHSSQFSGATQFISWFDGDIVQNVYQSPSDIRFAGGLPSGIFVVENIIDESFLKNILFISTTGNVDTLNSAPIRQPRTYLDGEVLYVFPSQQGAWSYTTTGTETLIDDGLEGVNEATQATIYFNDQLVLYHDDGVALTDGSSNSAKNVFDKEGEVTETNGKLLLLDNFRDLYGYDPATDTTINLTADLPGLEDMVNDPRFLLPTPNGAVFSARGSVFDYKLFVTNGTRSGTRFILPPSNGAPVEISTDIGYRPFSLGEYIIFTQEPANDERQVWLTDGTDEGTYPIFSLTDPLSLNNGQLYGGVLSTGELIVQVGFGSFPGRSTLYRLNPQITGAPANEVTSLSFDLSTSPVLLNDKLLLKERAFSGDTLFALDLFTSELNTIGLLDVDRREPLFELDGILFYESNVTSTSIDTIVAIHGNPLELTRVLPHFGDRAEVTMFTIGAELYAYVFDDEAGESLHTINPDDFTSERRIDLFPDNAGRVGEGLTTYADRLLWNTNAFGEEEPVYLSDGTVEGTIVLPAQDIVNVRSRPVARMQDRQYFLPLFRQFGLRELNLSTGATRDLDSLLLGQGVDLLTIPVLLNDKLYAVKHNLLSSFPLLLETVLLEIDPIAGQTRIVAADTTTNEDTRYSVSMATDGNVVYFTHQREAGANPASYDPVTETVTDLAEPVTSTFLNYANLDGIIAVESRFLDQLPTTYRLSENGIGEELSLQITNAVVRGLGNKLLYYRSNFGNLFSVDKTTGDSTLLISNGGREIANLTYYGDNEMVFLRQDDDSETYALWRTDGTRSGTVRVVGLESENNLCCFPISAAVVDNFVVARMSNDDLFLIDVETALYDRLDVELTQSTETVAFDGKIFFFADDPVFGIEPHFLTITEQNLLQGTVFRDENADGIQNEDEPGIPFYPVAVSGGAANLIYTNQDGEFSLRVSEGRQYEVAVATEDCYEAITTTSEYSLTYSADSTYNLNFGLQPGSGPATLRTLLNSSTIRCGFEHDFWLTVLNDGCQPLAGEAAVTFPEEMEFLGSDETPLSNEDNTLTFAFDTLLPNASQRIRIRFRMPDENFAGQLIDLGAVAGAVSGQGAMITSDTFAYSEILRCAIDPNDKQVSPSRPEPSNSNYTQFDETLRYTIRFQNTGNDTAFTVRIQDQIDESLNLETFKPLAASHPYSVSVRDDRTVVFLFENILLPDSTTNLPGSQGFVTFEINAHPGLDDFSTIPNTAGIYFDFNQPVITNTVTSTLVEFLDEDQDGFLFYEDCDDKVFAINPAAPEIPNNGIDENCDDLDDFPVSTTEALSGTLEYFPNPTSDILTLRYSDNTPLHGELYAANGVRLRVFVFQNTHSLSLEEFPAGLYLVRLYSEEGRGAVIRVVRR